MREPIRIAVLGSAAIARRRMLPAFAASPETEVVAIASRDPERAEELAGRYACRAVHGYEAVLADDSVQAVYVPLPAALHAEWTEAALLAGKHVLAEKPLTTDSRRTAALFELARARGLALVENVLFVHHPQHQAVRKLLTDGAIGEPRSFQAAFAVPRLRDDDIRYRPELGGGALWDTGVYPLRAALHLLGPVLEVLGAVLSRAPGFAVDTAGAAFLADPGGVTAHLTFGLDHGYRNVYELHGSEGRITVEMPFTPPADHVPVLRIADRTGRESEIRLEAEDQVVRAVSSFAAHVRQRSAPEQSVLLQAALLEEVLAVAGRSDASARAL